MSERIDTAAVQQRWEYRVERMKSFDLLESLLGELGQERWELVSVTTQDSNWFLILKRPGRQFSRNFVIETEIEPVGTGHPK